MITEYLKKSKEVFKWLIPFVAAIFLLFGCSNPNQVQTEAAMSKSVETEVNSSQLDEGGSYTGKEDVALYIHTYNKLPGNFITKKQAEKAGWISKEGNLWEVAPGKSIGGSKFGNYDEQLPEKDGRNWQECDIDFDGSYRGAKRMIYSNDGLIYYTGDHYKTFEQLY